MTGKTLPIEAVLGDVAAALGARGLVVLEAPPGAGKTTRIPLFLIEKGLIDGRILMLEPRRVAARAAAERMAEMLGEATGGRVGYRIRGEARVSRETRIEVVTEGILTRMIQSDPSLDGVGCVIFDEFHERSVHADLGLALVHECRAALREDLKLVVMSATLDAAPIAALLGDAPLVRAEGQSWPVETIWLNRPWADPARSGRQRLEPAVAASVHQALAETTGSVLVFLPGAGEINRLEGLLKGNVGPETEVLPLYGAMSFAAQKAALRPAPKGKRRVVLATSIAETSLTIPDVAAVVDAGRSRRPRFDPQSGMTRLSTERVTKAEATQRQGRAGRVGPGRCYRLWTRGEEGGMALHPPPEIADNDLMSLALELAAWGVADARSLAFLTPPPEIALQEARAMLVGFGALTPEGFRLTDHGKRLAALPLHPRLGQMVLLGEARGAGQTARQLAALLSARPARQGPLAGNDLDAVMLAIKRGAPGSAEILREARRLGSARDTVTLSTGALLSLAYPDRIAQRRGEDDHRYLLTGGRGAEILRADMVAAPWLVVADLDGAGRNARIRRAAVLGRDEIEAMHGPRIQSVETCHWDSRQNRVIAERQTRLDALVLSRNVVTPQPDALLDAMLEGFANLGPDALNWTPAARRLRARIAFAGRHGGEGLPDVSDQGLCAGAGDWLAPFLQGASKAGDLRQINLATALDAWLGWHGRQMLNDMAPPEYRAPSGSRVPVNYDGDAPAISVRLQDMLGLTTHPRLGPDRTPVVVTLLSPARRPIQTTSDLPGFWSSSYEDVRKEMRGRYPKHDWPQNPAAATPVRGRPKR